MPQFTRIREWFVEPRVMTRGAQMRLTGIVTNGLGAVYAWLFAAMFAVPGTGGRVALCGVALAAASVALVVLPPKPIFATISALLATANISVILTVPDPTGTVPLFYLWPLVALAYFHSPKMLAVSVGWAAATLAPVLLIGATPAQQVTYIGAISITSLLAALIGFLRHDEQSLRRALERSSSTDSLTGLLNRRAFSPAYEQALAEAKERGDGLSVVLIDLDHFKRYNDSHGHVTGDAALRRTARVLQAAAEPGDVIARLGGEEFAAILPGRGAAAAQRYCDRIAATIGPALPTMPADTMARAGIRATLSAQLRAVAPEPADGSAEPAPGSHADPRGSGGEQADGAAELPPITSSFGITHVSPSDERTPEEILGHADEALYAAKRAGRDRAAVWSPPGPMLGAPMHAAGILVVDAQPVITSRRGQAAAPTADAVRALRSRIMGHITSGMLLTGALNSFARAALLPLPALESAVLVTIGMALVVVVMISTLKPSEFRHAPTEAFIGVAAVTMAVVLVAPPITATFFYTWPITMAAYFARPRVVAAAVAWMAVTLAAGLLLTQQPIDEAGMLAGVLLNMALLAGVITGLRWRETQLADRLEAAAATDPLTGALTRRAFIPAVEGWLADAPGAALLLVDLDHFKRYNDEHGHLAGDDALRSAAAALRAAAPEGALVCRFGGEEFAIGLPNGAMAKARACADQIAEQLAVHPDALTISGGIAVARTGELELDRLVARADQALYAAKGAGRARVAWFAADSEEELLVAEPIRVARPAAFAVIDGGAAPGAADDLSSAA